MPLLKKLETEGTTMTPLTGNQPKSSLQSETPRAVDTTGNVQ